MQVRDLIEELQRFDPRDEVRIDIKATFNCPKCEIASFGVSASGNEIEQLIKAHGCVIVCAWSE